MQRHRPIPLLVGILSALFPILVATPVVAAPALPSSMAATGDSITQAFATRTGFFWFTDNPAASWSTGTTSSVASHYSRILAQNAAISGHNANDAVSGATMADLAGQMQSVVSQHPAYVTVLMGGNDLCTDTTGQMTSVADFDARFRAAMAVLQSGDPDALVFVASVPDAYHLWELFKDNSSARTAWSLYGVCQSLLANPQSTAQADVDRRAFVRQRNADYNAVLAQACADYGPSCRFDGNAVFSYPFATSDINTHDYFHPSLAGQAALAAVTWSASFWGTAPPPNQPPAAAFSASCTDLACSFTDQSSDADGSVAAWSWTFGDGGTATAQNPAHSYAAGGTYTVRLTVTDDGGATGTTSQQVTVSASPPAITLSATLGTQVKNRQPVNLAWSGATGAQVDLYRNGSLVTATANDGAYTDNLNARQHGTYTYRVCLTGTTTCSNDAGVTF